MITTAIVLIAMAFPIDGKTARIRIFQEMLISIAASLLAGAVNR